MAALTLTVNGRRHKVEIDPATALFYTLSEGLELRLGTTEQPHPIQRAFIDRRSLALDLRPSCKGLGGREV
jgi:hypothetical protein